MKKIFPILIFAYVAYLVFTTSCANPGMPVGGLKDTIPPVVVKTSPEFNGRNYKGNTVSLTFNEFVITDELRDQLVVSPPVKKRPVIRSKSKTLIIDLGDSLKANATYSLDFKNAIADNNEKNPLEGFRFSFSTGPDFDSLMIGGYVKKAENLEPVEGALVLLHSRTSLGAFKDTIPDYIAKTDKDGFYVLSNIAEGAYRLYAILDTDNSMTFNQELELIAFYDSLVVPRDLDLPEYEDLDEMLDEHIHEDGESHEHEEDTLGIIAKRQQALHEPFILMMYEEEVFDQYLDDAKRDRNNLIHLYFSESLRDSFSIELLSPTPSNENWKEVEFNPGRDSVMLWITDTVLVNADTLKINLAYLVPDSLKNPVLKNDTLSLYYAKPEETKRRRRKDDDEVEKIPHIAFKHNLKGKGFDIYSDILIEAPEPLESFDPTMVHLFQKVDTLEHSIAFEMSKDSLSSRKYTIKHPWEFEAEYRLLIDSAAAKNYFGHPSSELNQKFSIQEEAYYAKIILVIGNLKGNGIVQLLENTDKEKVLQQIRVEDDSEINFPFLKPEKYKIRLVLDRNGNGVWDTGKIEEGRQPEQVLYFQKILKLRSNFQIEEEWVLPDGLQYQKELIDEDKKQEDKNKSSKPNQNNRRQGF